MNSSLVAKKKGSNTYLSCIAIATLVVCAVIIEVAFRLFPQSIPAWYRSQFPINGIELFKPGILSETPIEGVPLPYNWSGKSDYSGPPPKDLVNLGLVSPDNNPDTEIYSEVVFKKDKDGLPNSTERDQADIVLIGDSFTYAAGVWSPPGLQKLLSNRIALSVHNLGIPSIGPQREKYMLETLGLQLKPQFVIWFFFAGNDIQEANGVETAQRNNIKNYGQLFESFKYPKSYLAGFLTNAVKRYKRSSPTTEKVPLPPFILKKSTLPKFLWFHPKYIRNLRNSVGDWQTHKGFEVTKHVLADTARDLKSKNISMLLVYIPSKPEIYLPHVEYNPLLAHEMASFDLTTPLTQSPNLFWKSILQNRNSLNHALSNFAKDYDIDYLSLSPKFNRAAMSGVMCYLSADTHWNEIGQELAVQPITDWINSIKL